MGRRREEEKGQYWAAAGASVNDLRFLFHTKSRPPRGYVDKIGLMSMIIDLKDRYNDDKKRS